MGDHALAGWVAGLHRLETAVAAEKLRRIAEVDARQAYRAQGALSTAELLAQRLRLTRGEARAQAGSAVALESLPQTAATLRDSIVGVGQARVAARALDELPAEPAVRAQLDRMSPTRAPAAIGAAWTSVSTRGRTRSTRRCRPNASSAPGGGGA